MDCVNAWKVNSEDAHGRFRFLLSEGCIVGSKVLELELISRTKVTDHELIRGCN
jgi:hypothetical protein